MLYAPVCAWTLFFSLFPSFFLFLLLTTFVSRVTSPLEVCVCVSFPDHLSCLTLILLFPVCCVRCVCDGKQWGWMGWIGVKKGGKAATTIDNKDDNFRRTMHHVPRVEQASCKASTQGPQDLGKTWVQHVRLHGFMHVHPSRFCFSRPTYHMCRRACLMHICFVFSSFVSLSLLHLSYSLFDIGTEPS